MDSVGKPHRGRPEMVKHHSACLRALPKDSDSTLGGNISLTVNDNAIAFKLALFGLQ